MAEDPIPIRGIAGEYLGSVHPSPGVRNYVDHGGILTLSPSVQPGIGRYGRREDRCVELSVLGAEEAPHRDETDDPERWPEGRLPDGWMIVHHRAVGASCYFGPWPTHGEAMRWWRSVGEAGRVAGSLIPMWLDVDWNRG